MTRYFDCYLCDNDGFTEERAVLWWDQEIRVADNGESVYKAVCRQCARGADGGTLKVYVE